MKDSDKEANLFVQQRKNLPYQINLKKCELFKLHFFEFAKNIKMRSETKI